MTQRKSRSQRIVKIALAVIALTWAALPGANRIFTKRKTITMVQGRAPEDRATSAYGRSCRFSRKNLPGNPTIVSDTWTVPADAKRPIMLFRVAGRRFNHRQHRRGFVASAVLGRKRACNTTSISLFISARSSRPITFFIQGASWA